MDVFHSAESLTISEYELHIPYSKLMLNIVTHQHMILRTKSEESVKIKCSEMMTLSSTYYMLMFSEMI